MTEQQRDFQICRHCGCEIYKGNGHIWWHRPRDDWRPHQECSSLSVAEPIKYSTPEEASIEVPQAWLDRLATYTVVEDSTFELPWADG